MIFETKPTIVGHRGFGAGTPAGYRENTLESYLAAVAHGLSWIELDVRRSLDGQLVIRHDPVTADGEFIAGQTADQLAAADAVLRASIDDEGVARLAAHLVLGGHRVLAHCCMGFNRSALVAGLILNYLGMSGPEAVTLLRERRPGA